MAPTRFELIMAWSMANEGYAFVLAVFVVATVAATLRCLFKALGGGYLPRKHCASCECETHREVDDD